MLAGDCSYGAADGGGRLCVPRFCEAPPAIKAAPWAQMNDNYLSVPRVYNFTATGSDGQLRSTLFEARADRNYRGYNLEKICKSVSLAPDLAPCAGASCPPSSPPMQLYEDEGDPTTPKGCKAIKIIPTLTKYQDLELSIVWVIVIVYMFYAMALVCEEFFVPSITVVCERLHIPEDIASATLLAMGCNAPELFASIISVFVADSTVGIGTVVGSTPFNLYCIVGASATVFAGGIVVDPWMMGRELSALLVAILMYYFFMADELIVWWEALVMVLYYFLIYVPFLALFPKIKARLERCFSSRQTATKTVQHLKGFVGTLLSKIKLVRQQELRVEWERDGQKQKIRLLLPPGEPEETMQLCFDLFVLKIDEHRVQVRSTKARQNSVKLHLGMEEEVHHEAWYRIPSGRLAKVSFFVTLPIRMFVYSCMPDVRQPGKQKYWLVSMVFSMLWMAIFAYIFTSVVDYVGCAWGLTGSLLGLSIGAAGTSFPNMIASMYLARIGQGSNACVQAIAANTFNLCIGLGLIWLMHTLHVGNCSYGSHGNNYADCNGCYAPDGFQALCPYWEGTGSAFHAAPGSTKGCLLLSLIFMVIFTLQLIVCKGKVPKWAGRIYLAIYAGYILYQILAAFIDSVLIFIKPWYFAI
ncbi:sodium potassium calcium exchanger 3 [Chrysochromulina tobinii]|uniref:Sodium potassium calcium exchanger 3 n=1 Tax=Chrysochromulina tobinii TaxID=1460289 RepID=A0A0M0JKG0_9EUKA|nr:sodium potassium calcium exchanger 3 [Chrysochromulina tobinii]|eukprot:KOO26832.1 sodium potassium calcium exchanger 3 [Chrysochromulina sp. CCMP291]